ncbi:alpha-amylase family glycosyl hydrolase [Hahella sp. CCB-MM4]|uniref:alpha-amylase family glycosyl hydrolase n=1 Tax=Hahella sp. (strain CCB-MM4) TaxID=1926491 RepID=UPI001FED2AC5|nr:alpha-amylase family glycosyl hydrolase [Hahella sp. CCB-MM4]
MKFPNSLLLICLLIIGLMAGCASKQVAEPGPLTHFSDSLDLSPVMAENRQSTLPEDWYRKAVFMEIYVRGFKDSDGNGVGDFNGIIEKLDYLKELGIGGIWLMPMMKSQDNDHGYAVVDYRATEKDYGTLEDFKRLLDEAHKRGIGVIVDYVINHSAALNPLFKDSQHPLSDKRDWYIWSEDKQFWPRWDYENTWHEGKHGYYYGVFWSQMPDFNMKNPEVLEFHKNNLRFWMNLGVDGFRFDAVGSLVENGNGAMFSQPENDQILQELQQTLGEFDNRYMVCEDPTGSLRVGKKESCGSAFYFGMHKELIASATYGWPSRDLIGAVKRAPHNDMAIMLANHDSFAGNRVIKQVGGDETSYKMAATLLLTLPGIPFVYYGEEIGMGHGEKAFGDHALRAPMSWNSDPDTAGFTTAKRMFRLPAENRATYNVEDELKDPESLLSFYRSLINARNNIPALQTGDFENIKQDAASLLTFLRKAEDAEALIMVNLGRKEATARYQSLDNKIWTPAFTHNVDAVNASNGEMVMPPYSIAIFTRHL